MNKIVIVIGIFLFIAGGWGAAEVVRFKQRAIEVVGTVTGVEELRGPPKPRQKTPLHVSYQLSDGRQLSAVTHLPFLQQVKQGDQIRLLVDPQEPSVAELPLWSELWARPLTYLIGGILVIIVGQVLGMRRSR